ncbi:MAG: DsrE family protein [Thiobacillus sp.]|nr:DsrE family protein [Thiobacillus sp.]
MKWGFLLISMLALSAHARHVDANDLAPWGSATEIQQTYSGQKVVFDTTSESLAGLTSVLDRASLISVLNGADPLDNKIVIVLHGGAIPFFAIKNYTKHKELMHRAQSLSVGEVVEYRMCRAAAHLQGFKPEDIHGFVKMVPMADAEIVRLQQEEGFAYMQ